MALTSIPFTLPSGLLDQDYSSLLHFQMSPTLHALNEGGTKPFPQDFVNVLVEVKVFPAGHSSLPEFPTR
jgi:hypothetical protein